MNARADFPALQQEMGGKPLVYLDSGATTQKPQHVIDAMGHFYKRDNANVHRGVHTLSQRATLAFEHARFRAADFLHARDPQEIVFVRGTTEAINLVAHSFVRPRLNSGDEVLITGMEHHSNIVPWQMLCEERDAKLRVLPVNDRGELVLDTLDSMLTPRTRIFALTHVSNALGTVNPVKSLVQRAHAHGVPVLLDGAQAVSHFAVDVQDLDCDFYAFSGHKVFGPTGIGVLYGKAEHLERMPPYQGGGEMILSVSFERTVYHRIPHRFEAGTPNIAGAVGLGAALEYVQACGLDAIAKHDADLLSYATQAVTQVPGLSIMGTAADKVGVLSLVMDEVHPHDIGTVLDREGVAIRAGHHCAQPLMQRFGVNATARASFALYNTRADVDALVRALHKVKQVLG